MGTRLPGLRTALGRTACAWLLTAGAAAGAGPIPTPVAGPTDPLSVTSPQVIDGRAPTLPELAAARGVAGAVWARDGRSLVFSSNLAGRYNLWELDTQRGFPRQLTVGDEVQVPVAVTPEGRVLYLQDSGGNELWDLYSVPAGGGATVNLTGTPEAAESAPVLSRDGRRIALSYREKEASAVDLGWLDPGTGDFVRLTQETDPFRVWKAAGWLPDGQSLIATRSNATDTEATVYEITLEPLSVRRITPEQRGLYTAATDVSPDGERIAITTNGQTGQLQAAILDRREGMTRWFRPTPWEQTAGAFSPDGRTLLLKNSIDGRVSVSAADARTGAERTFAIGPGVTAPSALGQPWRDSREILVHHESGSRPPEYWSIDIRSGRKTQLTFLTPAMLPAESLPTSAIVSFRSADGTPVSGVLTIPANLARDGSHPGVVMPHGGPNLQSLDDYDPDATTLASRGFFVLRPNYRGSTGYGRDFLNANVKDLGGGDLDDLVAAAEFLVATGYVDRRRIGIVGGSYGGFLTLMALGRKPEVFSAGVNMFGILDWTTLWNNTVAGLQEYQRALAGDPVIDREAYVRQSPVTYLDRFRAPLLVLQGDNDPQIPRLQSQELVDQLRARRVTVDAVFYPGEGHGFAREENQRDARQRIVSWFENHLKASPPQSAGSPLR